jgi:hypothetical protein
MRVAERHEQEAGLVHVPVVLVDDDDLDLVGREPAAQAVRGERPAGAAAEDHDALRHVRPSRSILLRVNRVGGRTARAERP